MRKFGLITEGLNIKSDKINNRITVFWNGLNLIRWSITIIIIVFLKDYNAF
jgi:hypothetical protein